MVYSTDQKQRLKCKHPCIISSKNQISYVQMVSTELLKAIKEAGMSSMKNQSMREGPLFLRKWEEVGGQFPNINHSCAKNGCHGGKMLSAFCYPGHVLDFKKDNNCTGYCQLKKKQCTTKEARKKIHTSQNSPPPHKIKKIVDLPRWQVALASS